MVTRNWEAFESFVEEAMKYHKIPGMAVAVSEKGRMIFEKGFGTRDRDTGAPVDRDTVFGIASVSKCFTTLAIMQLVDEGRLAVDDPVVKHVPEFRMPGVDPIEKITLHHLMSHTTGLPPLPGLFYAMKKSMKDYPKWDDTNQEKDSRDHEDTPELKSFAEHIRYLAGEKYDVLGEPGEYFSYSNDCYCVLGSVIEHVTGMDYYDYMQQRIFDTIGMKRSTFSTEVISKMDNVTKLYFNNKRRETMDVPRWQELGPYDAGGGIKSTIADLIKYAEVYVNKGMAGERRIVSSTGVEATRKLAYEIGRGIHYGYGLQVTPDYAGVTLVEHGGSLTGVSSNLGYVPERGLAIVVLINVSGAPAADFWLRAANTALGLPMDQKRSVEPHYDATPEQLAKLCGTFKSGEGAKVRVFMDGAVAKVEVMNEQFELRASDERTLVYEVYGQTRVLKFYLDSSGKPWAVFTGLRMIRKDD